MRTGSCWSFLLCPTLTRFPRRPISVRLVDSRRSIEQTRPRPNPPGADEAVGRGEGGWVKATPWRNIIIITGVTPSRGSRRNYPEKLREYHQRPNALRFLVRTTSRLSRFISCYTPSSSFSSWTSSLFIFTLFYTLIVTTSMTCYARRAHRQPHIATHSALIWVKNEDRENSLMQCNLWISFEKLNQPVRVVSFYGCTIR